MPFSELLTDTVFVEKSDGSRVGPFKAALSATSASIFDLKLDVDEGEHLVRPLPNGKNEVYLVTLVAYNEGLGGIPPSFTLTLQKTTAIRSAPAAQTNVHINNSTGIQVGNHNVVNIRNALNDLVQRIDTSGASYGEKKDAKGRLSALLSHPLVTSILGGVAGGIAGH